MSDKESPKAEEPRVVRMRESAPDLITDGKMTSLLKAKRPAGSKLPDSERTSDAGEKVHLIDKHEARQLRAFNTTHAICLEAKESATVGLGHRERKIHEVLDPLTSFGWQDTLDALAQDYWETGDCYLEVVRDEDGVVDALYHVESAKVYVVQERIDSYQDYHYVVMGEDDGNGLGALAFPAFGDRESFNRRLSVGQAGQLGGNNAARFVLSSRPSKRSEIVHIRQPTNRSPWYGFPDYVSATPSAELVQMMTQQQFDFYFNRAVPEFLFILKGSVSDDCWGEIEDMIRASQGKGNSRKTAAINLQKPPDQVEVEVIKLGMENSSGDDGFADKSSVLAMNIATAHGMPPILANIAIPGKAGAANEGPNAMLLFQKRKLAKAQRIFSSCLARTLGSPGVTFRGSGRANAAGQSLPADLFLGTRFAPGTEDTEAQRMVMEGQLHTQYGNGFNSIIDGMSMGAMDTLARMREPLAGSDRDLEAGVRTSQNQRAGDDPRGRGDRGGMGGE